MKNPYLLILLAIAAIGYVLIYQNEQPSRSIVEKTEDETQTAPIQIDEVDPTYYAAEETHFLFDIAEHGSEEMKALLERAEALSHQEGSADKDIKIAMVIHGPDMDLFDKKNYHKHKEIVDLAARLDASNVIDFKICKTVANIRGISTSSFPSFMELVPFGPDELDNLEEQGYIEL